MEKPIEFSLLERNMSKLEEQVRWKKLNAKSDAWNKDNSTKDAVEKRLQANQANFWAFDQNYYSEDMYSDGYSQPAPFHHFLVECIFVAGVIVVLGPRRHAKTATIKKAIPWLLLTGKMSFIATASAVLATSRNMLGDIVDLLDNEKMKYDYKFDIIEANQEQVTINIPGLKQTARIIALSEGRSARGATKLFDRPQFIFFDDLETRQSPLGEEQVISRIKILQESYQSMSENGCLFVVGNNFDERCALNQLLLQHKEGFLSENWKIYTFPAWQGSSLWQSRYPAKSEEELKEMCKVADEQEWLGDFQQQPTKPDGYIFKRIIPLPKWQDIPDDARGVLWCDPNLSLKSKGDSTAILSLLYSPSSNFYYLQNVICKSYSDSDKLLTDYLNQKTEKIRYCGFDGNVSQESTWTNNVRNWCRLHQKVFPTIFYKRYRVDELVKNIQSAWIQGKILLPPNIETSPDGQQFVKQLFSYQGKKANKRDDAPDALICAFELLHESKLGGRAKTNAVKKITDFFNF